MAENMTNERQEKKRLFMGLVLVSILFLMGAAAYLFAFASDPQSFAFRSFMIVLIGLFFLIFFFFFVGLLAMTLILLGKRPFPAMQWFIDKTLLILFPVVMYLGRLFHITQDKIQRSFIEVNNQLVRARRTTIDSQQCLILLPHCLQKEFCPHKITLSANNCQKCGRCQIGEIIDLAAEKKVGVEVVAGGTMARRALEQYGPRAVVAVACERDLSSGVLDSFPLPVIGVLNQRPEGPCINTKVDIEALKGALNFHLMSLERINRS